MRPYGALCNHQAVKATWGNIYWPVFLIVTLAAFLSAEIYALVTGGKNSLSDWVWRALVITEKEPITAWSSTDYLVFGSWLVLVSWLTWHFFFRMFRL